jgi:2,4-dienoyl-CoA reductase (NADPH2)
MKKRPVYPQLFKTIKIGGLKLKNRITMAPLYLGYAAPGGKPSELMHFHYEKMAGSGAALVVVENASITPQGSGSGRTLRCDHNRYLNGLAALARRIKGQKALACLQINHAGRFAAVADAVAPSPVPTFGRTPQALTTRQIRTIQNQFVKAALRVKQAGFDMVELHGGTGYLLSQFVSPKTNRRDDRYGGTLSKRIAFPLEVLKRVQDTVGDFPIGYRFLADEWLPDGLKLKESLVLAQALAENGIAYISVMGGTYESFLLPEVVKKSKRPGYMVSLANAVKRKVKVPVITAGRISTPAKAEKILQAGQADLIGLARMLWVDPQWPLKARKGLDRSIIKCSPNCDACFQLVTKGKPAFCPKWPKEHRAAYRGLYK